MDGPTLITQPPGYPEERPETDDMDGMLEHLASELEGKQLLEKPRVSKKVTLLGIASKDSCVACTAVQPRRAEITGWHCCEASVFKLAEVRATKLHRIQKNTSFVVSALENELTAVQVEARR